MDKHPSPDASDYAKRIDRLRDWNRYISVTNWGGGWTDSSAVADISSAHSINENDAEAVM